MRTAADLQGAFTLLEERADAYAGPRTDHAAGPGSSPDEVDGGTGAPVELVPRRRRPSRALAITASLAAAAAVVAAAVGVAVWSGGEHGSTPTGDNPVRRPGPVPRTYRVALDPKLGMHLLEVSAEPTATGFDFYSRSAHAQVTMIPAAAHQRLTPGLERVMLSGGRPAYYSDGTRPLFVEPAGDPATAAPAPTPTAPDTRYARALVWPLTPGTYLQVVFQNARPTKAQLVRVASGLRVGRAQPIPSALSLRAAPPGMRLVSVDSLTHAAGDNPPYELAGRGWFTDVQYRPGGSGDGVSIQATSVDVTHHPRSGARPVSVGGHAGYWYAKDRELDLDLGQGRYVSVSGTAEGAATAGHTTRSQLVAVARTITMTTHPRQPVRWFPATRALP